MGRVLDTLYDKMQMLLHEPTLILDQSFMMDISSIWWLLGDYLQEETDEGQYDNSPSNPRKPPPFGANQFANQENQPGQGDRMDGNMPKATMEQQLMADYKKFISETN